jgi:hypothetical protein
MLAAFGFFPLFKPFASGKASCRVWWNSARSSSQQRPYARLKKVMVGAVNLQRWCGGTAPEAHHAAVAFIAGTVKLLALA